MAEAKENMPRNCKTVEDLEYQYWRNIRFQPPLYGADVEGSLFDEDLEVVVAPVGAEAAGVVLQGWTIRDLNTILSARLQDSKVSIPGVVTPYLYFGMWKSTFAW
eukprot:scaffold17821_cov42-Prasinocladus_malaysianus.AAC.1